METTGAAALLPVCERVMNDTSYEGQRIAENEGKEVFLISARSLKRICELKKEDTGAAFVAEFHTAEEFASLMWRFKQAGTIRS